MTTLNTTPAATNSTTISPRQGAEVSSSSPLLLDIENLSVTFGKGARAFRAVDDVSLQLKQGEVLAVVGESGSGKSVTMMALMGLLPSSATVGATRMQFDGKDMLTLSERERRKIIGKDISMIFQNAMSCLNPSFTVEYQLAEVLKTHLGLKGAVARQRILELLELVEIPDAKNRLSVYPHQLSGGMSQRVMIAMALACEPKLLIADEPTTALDVTVQAQIMDLLSRLQREKQMAMVLITHDLGLVAQNARDVAVMYAGQMVETNTVPEIFEHPSHPYTEALLQAIPELAIGQERLNSLPGVVPSQYDRPKGCLLSPRCPYKQPECEVPPPILPTPNGRVRCIRTDFPAHTSTTMSHSHSEQTGSSL
ncbi:ABC transporter ATP-binding protein [Psychrobacter sanguinis]|uniref:ABC transporter ATP-binding protein n=1 Tax=Psychrobacter sanguinis TaxID=861445 RepID=UPI00020C9B90|nr:ABC transporter ATP-binding protein [Psychrobacter sanguinis]EGK11396.1 dipeptide ABC superfamily ATP binding cassette transporter, ABC protein [Psychrobacter sp. 1501(2011)]MCD9152734.1 ABC transporter ATP-binding protein [Psychrobacter sanguinis]MDY3306270.1 ABC transporter ATP-binding protein [Psychrobacter sanguinis]